MQLPYLVRPSSAVKRSFLHKISKYYEISPRHTEVMGWKSLSHNFPLSRIFWDIKVGFDRLYLFQLGKIRENTANSAGFLSHLNGRKKGKESKIKIEIISETFGGRREGCDFFAFLKRLGEKSWHCVRRRSKTWMRRSIKKVLCVVPHSLQRKIADLCLMPRICAA